MCFKENHFIFKWLALNSNIKPALLVIMHCKDLNGWAFHDLFSTKKEVNAKDRPTRCSVVLMSRFSSSLP